MGHASTKNISVILNRFLKRREGTTIKEVVDELEAHGEVVHAGEGELPERCMLSMVAEQIVEHFWKEGLIEPRRLSERQKKILKEWPSQMDWDCGEDGESGKYGILDSVLWMTERKRLPVITYIEN